MNIEQVKEVVTRQPFEPFKLQLADGTEIVVQHPECLAFHPRNARSISVALPVGVFKIVDLLLVAAIHVGNGSSPKPRKKR